jgi:hypothetical protein
MRVRGVPGRWLVTRGEFGADEIVHNASVHLPPEKVLLEGISPRRHSLLDRLEENCLVS